MKFAASISSPGVNSRSVERMRFCTSPSGVTTMSRTRFSESRRNSMWRKVRARRRGVITTPAIWARLSSMVHCTLGRMGAAAAPEERRPKFGRIALIGKLPSAGITESLRELTDYLRGRGCEVRVEQHTAQALGVPGADYETLGK